MQKPFEIRRLGPGDAAHYRELRLEGLCLHPEAFGASWEDEASKPVSWFVERLENNIVFGGWMDGPAPSGVAGLVVPSAAKLRHKAVLWGIFVRPDARGTGLAAALVRQVIDHARPIVEEIRLTVVATNTAAVRLYVAAGFREYGLERRALKVGDRYYDDLLMALPLG